MAILGSTSLTGCNFIPDFIASGSRMIFEQTSSPTSWTKDTSFSNPLALRIVTGTLSPGGTQSFNTILTTRAVPITIGTAPLSSSLSSVSETYSTVSRTLASGTSASALADLPSHSHGYSLDDQRQMQTINTPRQQYMTSPRSTENSQPTGQSGQHSHSVTFGFHSHQLRVSPTSNAFPPHNHTLSLDHSHSTIDASENFSVNYRDVIIATKN